MSSRADISVTNRPADHEYYLVLRARVSVSQHATRESGADVDIYDVRATALVPPVDAPASDTQIVIPLGAITKALAEDVCERVAASGLLQAAFQTRTDAGCTNAKVIGQDAAAAISTLATSRTSAPAEVRRSVGRPSIGPKVQVRIPDEQIAQLDQRAAGAGIDRTELIRQFVATGLRSVDVRAAQLDEQMAAASALDRDGTPEAHLAYLRHLNELRSEVVRAIDESDGPAWLRNLACDAETLASLHVDFHLLRNPQLGQPSEEIAELFEQATE